MLNFCHFLPVSKNNPGLCIIKHECCQRSLIQKIQIEVNYLVSKLKASFAKLVPLSPSIKKVTWSLQIKHECCLHSIHHLGRGRDHIRRQAPYSFIVEIGPFINLPVAATHEDMNSLLAASDPYFICNVCSTPALINLRL